MENQVKTKKGRKTNLVKMMFFEEKKNNNKKRVLEIKLDAKKE